ncbi:MAG: hypothetical protein RI998_1438 [Pseudomonadota bacterium]
MNTRRITWILLIGTLSLQAAMADGIQQAPALAIYNSECASCHMAYPPALLPSASWQRIMGSLNKHFGVDASLDAVNQQKITQWLTNNSAKGRKANLLPIQDRITKSEWFLRQHNSHEVPAAVWKRQSVGSPSNCTACHANATQGDFEEHNVRIPK